MNNRIGTPAKSLVLFAAVIVFAFAMTASAWAASDVLVTSFVFGGHGVISPAGTNVSYNKNTNITFTATPDIGYALASVTVDGSTWPLTNPFVVNTGTWPTKTVVVTFVKLLAYTVTGTPGAHGTVAPNPLTVFAGGGSTVTITPDPGYDLATLTDNGVNVSIAPPAANLTRNALTNTWTYALNNINANHTIAATFTPQRTYTVTATAGAGGTITPLGATTVDNYGSLSYTIAANAGYKLIDVVVDGVSHGPVTTYDFVNITANHTINAVFAASFNITASAGPNGTVNPSGTVSVIAGDSQAFTFTPAAGYVVKDVLVDGVSFGSITTYSFTNVVAHHTLSVSFDVGGTTLYDYCSSPSFLKQDIRPNLLLMFDNSASTYDLAYTTTTSCYDDTYNDGQTYPGYFLESQLYTFDTTRAKFVPSSAALPGACTFRTNYACISMAGVAGSRTVSTFVASGKFLNWLSMSKMDIQKYLLTGGKYIGGALQGESRGCSGYRFIKAVPALGAVTFAIRGPNEATLGASSSATSYGGQSVIEIYDGNYNKTDCLAALNDWITGEQMGTTQTDTKNCIGAGTNAVTTSIFNHITHDCYWFYNGKGLSNINSLEVECEHAYATKDPSAITDPKAGDAVCSSVLKHAMYNNNSDPNEAGFLGRCWNKATGAWDDNCALTENMDYCTAIAGNGVTDPSTPNAANATGPVPPFVMESGLNALPPPAGAYPVLVSYDVEPTGLINEYKYRINFGFMQFNRNGSASECDQGTGVDCAKVCSGDSMRICYRDADCAAPQTCNYLPLTDGGRINDNGYINFSPAGDSTFGVVKGIDNIVASTWTPFSEAFYNVIGYFANRADLRLQASDFNITKNPSQFKCQPNNVLIITDGMSTADRNPTVNALAAQYHSTTNTTGWTATGPQFGGSMNLDDLAWLGKNRNIFDFTKAPSLPNESITTHVVYAGTPCSAKAATGACTSTDEAIPEVLMQHTATAGGGLYAYAQNPDDLRNKLRYVLNAVSAGGSSGTAASILSNSEGSGANILQAVFYPSKSFDNNATYVNWVGELQNLWYFIDPFIGKSSVREDTDYTATNLANNDPHRFNLKSDLVTSFFFDASTNQTMVSKYSDDNADGTGDTFVSTISPDNVASIWRAGRQLWKRDIATKPRRLFTQISGSLQSLLPNTEGITVVDTATATVKSYLQAASKAEADNIIAWTAGTDSGSYRSRSIKIPSVDTTARVWKLGDIISSTPRIQSGVRLNTYHLDPGAGYSDTSYDRFSSSSTYKNRGMGYVGANDGMLHAFKFGKLETASSGDLKATLSGTELGEEQWAFVPKNVLPYLKYLADKNYDHIFTMDGTPTLVDVSAGTATCAGNYWDCPKETFVGATWTTNWKTILVGGMGIGGASRDKASDATGNVVKTPVAGVGLSSYFALDVTNQSFDASGQVPAPGFLWEFSHPELGFATSGPAIIRIAATTGTSPDNTKNGRWFAVFASGPTGPIDANACQFKGRSDQNLKLFVVDLLNGPTPGNVWVLDTGIQNAFAGSISNGVIDTDRWNAKSPGNYQDDAIYIGYVKKAGDGTWTDGGVLRVLTKENIDPAQWDYTHPLIDGIGAVTTNVAKLQDRKNHKLWLYFGTGRYMFNQDDGGSTRRIFGVTDPCYKETALHSDDSTTRDDLEDKACTSQLSFLLDLKDQSTNPSATLAGLLTDYKGWYITLEGADVANALGAERSITDPVALTNGAVFFTTFKPTSDPCQFGGKSYMWGMKYDTGGSLFDASGNPGAALQGKALVQVSTGAFVQVDLSSAFAGDTASTKYNRRSASAMTGKPPGDPPPIITRSNLKPVKKVIHIQEH